MRIALQFLASFQNWVKESLSEEQCHSLWVLPAYELINTKLFSINDVNDSKFFHIFFCTVRKKIFK